MKNYILYILLFSINIGCSSNVDPKVKNTQGIQKNIDTTTISKPIATVNRNTNPNRIAKFIAGLEQIDSNELTHLQSRSDWKNFKMVFDSLWFKMETNRLNKQKDWVKENMKAITPEVDFLFYPFSGADFLNSNVFFPNAKKTIMIGLEPAGTLPDMNKFSKDSLDKYFNNIRNSLYSILKFSFYRTNSMAKDFKSEDINGTLPNILIFLARNGNDVIDVEPTTIDAKGNLKIKKFSDFKKSKNKGVKITYCSNKSDTLRELYYFSGDISNLGFKNDSSFYVYLNSLDFEATFLKSASFLMHKDYFSYIRNIILNKSEYILQDDSGVPFRFFQNKTWQTKVFGTYDKPISLFSNYFQKDFKDAYKDSTKVGKLPFGIGYDWKPNQSNLTLATKIRTKK